MHATGAAAPHRRSQTHRRAQRSAALSLLLFLLWSHGALGQQKPNIILILSDDVGAETLGIYGGESYRTPELDALARDGVRFAHGHAQPLCTPSRVKLMTGQYNFRNYRHFGHLDPTQTTFAHVLKSAGYRTSVVGKWQLYSNPFETLQGSTPTTAGFDDFLVWQLTPQERGSRYWQPVLNDNGELRRLPATRFGPDILNERVVALIRDHGRQPFSIYYSMVLAHAPWVTTPDMRDDSASDQARFAAMVAYMDKLVGNVRRAVEAQGIENNTLVLFIGDNGTDRDITSLRRGREVRGAKGRTINAGTQVPFMAWGPGLVQAGRVSNSLVNLNDVFPTLAELAGAPL
ncbi:MAG: sulfatase-like hydrolase/transferase, partial [Halioglobus sp.]|nr:sulfatase-like hydrolase/transferase [Halioglobus sp.]